MVAQTNAVDKNNRRRIRRKLSELSRGQRNNLPLDVEGYYRIVRARRDNGSLYLTLRFNYNDITYQNIPRVPKTLIAGPTNEIVKKSIQEFKKMYGDDFILITEENIDKVRNKARFRKFVANFNKEKKNVLSGELILNALFAVKKRPPKRRSILINDDDLTSNENTPLRSRRY